jgi:hypothetical protein
LQLVEKRRNLLEIWLNGLLSNAVAIDNEAMMAHMEIPADVLGWIRRCVVWSVCRCSPPSLRYFVILMFCCCLVCSPKGASHGTHA